MRKGAISLSAGSFPTGHTLIVVLVVENLIYRMSIWALFAPGALRRVFKGSSGLYIRVRTLRKAVHRVVAPPTLICVVITQAIRVFTAEIITHIHLISLSLELHREGFSLGLRDRLGLWAKAVLYSLPSVVFTLQFHCIQPRHHDSRLEQVERQSQLWLPVLLRVKEGTVVPVLRAAVVSVQRIVASLGLVSQRMIQNFFLCVGKCT
jgi:hypothetical protein